MTKSWPFLAVGTDKPERESLRQSWAHIARKRRNATDEAASVAGDGVRIRLMDAPVWGRAVRKAGAEGHLSGYIGRIGAPVEERGAGSCGERPAATCSKETGIPILTMTGTRTTHLPPVPRIILLLSVLTGAVVSLSALVVGGGAVLMPFLVAGGRPAWLLFGFEFVVLVAGVLAVLFGRGRYREGPGLALAAIAGTVFIGSACGYISVGKQLGTMSLTPLVALRVLLAGILAAGGAWCVLSRDPKSWRCAVLGVLLGLPAAALAGSLVIGAARRVLMGFVSGGGIVQTGIAVLGIAVAGGMLCASVHLIVKAFEMGRLGADRYCPGCGYDWKGLAVCPECGKARGVTAGT